MLAAYKLRAVPINVNYRYVEEELLYLLDNSDAVAWCTRPSTRPGRGRTRPVPLLRHSSRSTTAAGTARRRAPSAYEEALAAASPERDFGPRTDDDLYIPTPAARRATKGVVWRHEDVWRTLGGGIDFITGERIRTSTVCPATPRPAPERSASCWRRSMHGAAQWDPRRAHQGHHLVLLPQFDAHAVWT